MNNRCSTNKLGAAALVLGLGLSACASTSTEVAAPDVSIAFDEVSETTTTTQDSIASEEPVVDFQALVDQTLPVATDGPEGAGYQVIDVAMESGAFCDAVAPTSDNWLTAAAGAVEFEDDHYFRTDVEVYTTGEEAAGAYGGSVMALAQCDGEVRTDADTGSVVFVQTTDGGSYELPGSDEAGTTATTVSTDEFALDLTLVYARVDNVVLVAQGTEPGTTAYFMDLLMARLLNEADPAFVAPAAPPNVVDAAGGPSQGPAREVRALLPNLDLKSSSAAWFAAADDAVLNEVADIICPRLEAVPGGADSFAAIYGDAFTESERANLSLEDAVQVMLVITAPYCPDVYELLTT